MVCPSQKIWAFPNRLGDSSPVYGSFNFSSSWAWHGVQEMELAQQVACRWQSSHQLGKWLEVNDTYVKTLPGFPHEFVTKCYKCYKDMLTEWCLLCVCGHCLWNYVIFVSNEWVALPPETSLDKLLYFKNLPIASHILNSFELTLQIK